MFHMNYSRHSFCEYVLYSFIYLCKLLRHVFALSLRMASNALFITLVGFIEMARCLQRSQLLTGLLDFDHPSSEMTEIRHKSIFFPNGHALV